MTLAQVEATAGQRQAERSGRAELSTPLIPLTLRAMPRTRRPRARSSARPAFSLLSVLALLALACFPGLAQAEDISGIQYETDVPTVPSHESSNIPSKDKSGGTGAPSESDSEASSSESPSGAGSGGSDDSGQGGGTPSGQSNQGGGGDGATAGEWLQGCSRRDQRRAGASGHHVGTPRASDGGSSPLVPILIAIAVLAAISIGASSDRQRRQRRPRFLRLLAEGELARCRKRAMSIGRGCVRAWTAVAGGRRDARRSSPRPRRRCRPSFWGVVPQAASAPNSSSGSHAAASTASASRSTGARCSRSRAAAFDWSGLDDQVAEAAKAGIEVLPFLTGAPDLGRAVEVRSRAPAA